ncbi:helix-turn-helix transcriptional regulator [Methylobacterium longum]|uniref:Helix-turn-helix domain-containing protein n=1 Tax=Methylobacterium longum TaxID=767694 RepID=A0ABT8ATP1_9HYPH|nr:helix-turn-helix domain-containing protein [Methylobacterium longum]MDN3572795.1 helix-turn-helix domain-containing protein [Methylobacterium longum]
MAKSYRNHVPDDPATAPSNKEASLSRRHHLDRHASRLAELGDGYPDDLLSTRAVADWLGVSIPFLEIGRSRGYGPKFIRVAPARIRYRRSDVIVWLEERTFASTSKYGEVA